MTRTQSNFLLIVGFLLTFGGVGGIENSITDGELFGAGVISCVGLLIVWCGLQGMKVLDSYEV